MVSITFWFTSEGQEAIWEAWILFFWTCGFLTRPDTNSHRQGPTADSDTWSLLLDYYVFFEMSHSDYCHIKSISTDIFECSFHMFFYEFLLTTFILDQVLGSYCHMELYFFFSGFFHRVLWSFLNFLVFWIVVCTWDWKLTYFSLLCVNSKGTSFSFLRWSQASNFSLLVNITIELV
jgi:hypothetical protein